MIALGCDHGGYELMQEVKAYLDKQGLEYQDFGCYSNEAVDYPVYARKVGHAIQNGTCDKGILICGTGIGISIAANRYHGIRAALLYDDFTAEMAKKHNNANVIVFGGRTMQVSDVVRRIGIFMQTEFEGGRHNRRIEKIEEGK